MNEVVLIDICALSLGIETVGGVMTKIIERNSVVPTTKSKVVSTVREGQESINLQVFEGERSMTKDNNLLGKFDITGLTPGQNGKANVEVKFNLDTNGVLHVTAKEQGDGEAVAEMTINNDENRLSQDEIE